MNKCVLNVNGMGCPKCEKKVEDKINQMEGVKDCKASFKKGTVVIKYEDNVNLDEVKNNIKEVGYEVVD
ncbi:MAG: cation transporter [Acholeplasmatales bacterium]|nr:cation transporter [Acholeplasmatales bacterium]